MIAEAKKIDLAANLDYAMMLQFIDRLEKNGMISGDERMRLKDEIETKKGKPKVIDSAERVQKELKRMKVVNNRDNVFDGRTVDTHFERERVDMESEKVRWKRMDIKDLIQGMVTGEMEQQHLDKGMLKITMD